MELSINRVENQEKSHIIEGIETKIASNEVWSSFIDREFADKKSTNYEGHLYSIERLLFIIL